MASALSESQQQMAGDAFDPGGLPRHGTPLDRAGASGSEAQGASFSAAPDAGHGTTSEKASPAAMRTGVPKMRQEADRPQETSRFERLYAPAPIATHRLDTTVRGKMGRRGNVTAILSRGAPEKAGAFRPYYEVQARYRRAAEQSMRQEAVPPAYRKQVKDYFDALRR